jgi:Bacterial archaeo-eukaryotic release factor family 3
MSPERSIPIEPRVSIVLTTTPGPGLLEHDRQRLHRLINRVSGYLRGYPPQTIDGTLGRLRALADQGSRAPVDSGLQLTVGPGIDEIKQVPMARADRVILEPSPSPVGIQSSPLALAGDPASHRVIVLDELEIRLYEAVDGTLYEVRDGSFPIRPSQVPSSPRPFRDRKSSRGHRRAGLRALFFRADTALDRYTGTRPVPLVVVGLSRHLRLFRDVTKHVDLVIAEVSGNYGRTPAADLGPIVNRRLAARRAI